MRVLDIGCGPGGAFATLSGFDIEYHGVDIREDFIEVAKERYEGANFTVTDVTEDGFDFTKYDVIIALETFEHIPEGKLVRVIERMAASAPEFVLVSVPIEIGPSVFIKNFGARMMGYNRVSGNFWQTLSAGTYQLNKVPTHDTAHLGFNWIWLEQTLRQNFTIERSQSLPYSWLPKFLAPSIMFKCK